MMGSAKDFKCGYRKGKIQAVVIFSGGRYRVMAKTPSGDALIDSYATLTSAKNRARKFINDLKK